MTDPAQGWTALPPQNGALAAVSSAASSAGEHCLQFTQPIPVTVPDAIYGNPDYPAFLQSLNGGKGGGQAEVVQTVPVTAGQSYDLRLHYRTLGMMPNYEDKGTGKPRGYIATLDHFQRLVRLDVDRRTARVENAVESSPELMESIKANLAAKYGAGLNTTFWINRELIGGLRIKVGSDIYDGSVSARLAALQASF